MHNKGLVILVPSYFLHLCIQYMNESCLQYVHIFIDGEFYSCTQNV